MAKIRTIKPEFWDDEELAQLPYGCRLFYIGMWTHADDLGVIKANPVLLKSKIFPYDNTRIEEIKKWLDALSEARFIIPIQFKSESYYVIRTFSDHQKIDKRWFRSIIPETTLNQCIAGALRGHGETSTRTQRGLATGSGSVLGSGSNTPLPTDVGSPPIQKTKYKNFIEWVKKNASQVLKMSEPITEEQYEKLMADFGREKVCEILRAMHNYKPLLKKNNSAYLTARTWIKRDKDNGKNTTDRVASANGQKYGTTAEAKQGILARAAQLDGDTVKK